MTKIKVYSTPTCPYCKLAEMYLKKQGVEFDHIDVSVDEDAAREMIAKSGQTGVPVIEINGEIIIGFNKPEIDRALETMKRGGK
jgi:glutaredoxin 3